MAVVQRNYDKERVLTGPYNGDSLSQKEFHRLYEQMPEWFRPDLLDGTVFVRKPLGEPLGEAHGSSHLRLGSIIDAYQGSTPGVQGCMDATVILGEKDEVQPDLLLRIRPEYQGQSKDYFYRKSKGPYVQGAPELLAEIAHSSRAIDLHLKRQRYEFTGVIEYIVLCLEPAEIHWFDLRNRTTISADEAGVHRSIIFPGLWIHAASLLALDYKSAMDILSKGLASSEHANFVERLCRQKG